MLLLFRDMFDCTDEVNETATNDIIVDIRLLLLAN